MCYGRPMTNTTVPTITLQCANDHDIQVPATQTSGYACCQDCESWADVSHAFGNVGWCTVCGGVDGDHTDGCARA